MKNYTTQCDDQMIYRDERMGMVYEMSIGNPQAMIITEPTITVLSCDRRKTGYFMTRPDFMTLFCISC